MTNSMSSLRKLVILVGIIVWALLVVHGVISPGLFSVDVVGMLLFFLHDQGDPPIGPKPGDSPVVVGPKPGGPSVGPKPNRWRTAGHFTLHASLDTTVESIHNSPS